MRILLILAIPAIFTLFCYFVMVIEQYVDYRKRRLPDEKYKEFCKRVYIRYL